MDSGLVIGVRRISQWGGGLNIRPEALPTWLLMNQQYCVNDMSPVQLLYWWTIRQQQRETKIIIYHYLHVGYENYWATIFWLVQLGGLNSPKPLPLCVRPGVSNITKFEKYYVWAEFERPI